MVIILVEAASATRRQGSPRSHFIAMGLTTLRKAQVLVISSATKSPRNPRDGRKVLQDEHYDAVRHAAVGHKGHGAVNSMSSSGPGTWTLRTAPEHCLLNVAVSVAMVTGEALRQLGAFPTRA